MKKFTISEVAKLTRVKQTTLANWAAIGRIVCAWPPTPEHPTKRHFSYKDICRIILLRELLSEGMKLDAASNLALEAEFTSNRVGITVDFAKIKSSVAQKINN